MRDYTTAKPFTKTADQADLLIARGVQGDRKTIIRFLKFNNYYRVTGYLHRFKELGADTYNSTSFQRLVQIYKFDTDLRILLFKYISLFEVSFSRCVVYTMAECCNHGFPHTIGYKDTFDVRAGSEIERLLQRLLDKEIPEKIKKHDHEPYIKNYCSKYTPEDTLPIWILIETLSYGDTAIFFEALNYNLREKITSFFVDPTIQKDKDNRVIPKYFLSWVKAIRELRNRCAHHNRVYNYSVSFTASYPNQLWYDGSPTLYGNLICLRYLIQIIDPDNKFTKELSDIINKYDFNSELDYMKFPKNWRDLFPWNGTLKP